MPICEADPWRLQYFRDVDCPADLDIPTEDFDAWAWYPNERWVYDKIAVAHSQGLAAGPHGTTPPGFPVFSKPITNLKGMGIGSRVMRSADDVRPPLPRRPHVDDAARRRACQLRRRGGGRSAALVAARDRQAGRGGTFDFVDRARGSGSRHRAAVRRVDRPASRRLHRHAQPRNDRRNDHRGAPAAQRSVARPLWQPMGRCAGAALSGSNLAVRRSSTGATATASSCSDARGRATAIRPTRWCRRSCAVPASPACRSRSMKTARPSQHAMPPRRLPPGGDQLLGPRRRPCGARGAQGLLLRHSNDALPSRRRGCKLAADVRKQKRTSTCTSEIPACRCSWRSSPRPRWLSARARPMRRRPSASPSSSAFPICRSPSWSRRSCSKSTAGAPASISRPNGCSSPAARR